MNCVLWLKRKALQAPDAPALLRGTRLVADHATLARRAAALAGSFVASGLVPGERVMLLSANQPAYLEALFAIWWAGLVAVPVNAKLHPREAAYILEQSGAKAVCVDEEWRDKLAASFTDVRLITLDGGEYSQYVMHPPIDVVDVADSALAWLFYTSGTTGRPKGAMLTHGNLAAMCLNYVAQVDAIAPADCILHAAPLSHGSGLYALPHLMAGAAQVVPESGGFVEDEVIALLAAHRGVTMFAAPTMVKRLARHAGWTARALRGLKLIVYGGGPMYVADAEDALRIFAGKLAQIYGQGETPMTITALPRAVMNDAAHLRFRERLASVGVPFTGVEVRVCDKAGRELPVGEVGEIRVRGGTVMAGYWRDAAATAAALSEGWLLTGDLGSFDAEGFLTLKDRGKDLIISGGSNIYPREVEEVLLTHPGVAEVSVIGEVDVEWGEVVVACVVGRDGFADAAALDAHCLRHIARFKRPKQYRFLSALPKNAYGKVLKTALRESLR
ncbi:MAG: AMP-binding protein [Betaproteobacteria bacterium]|nr:AMP-binding protein [Betaproteobacteria bacterium]